MLTPITTDMFRSNIVGVSFLIHTNSERGGWGAGAWLCRVTQTWMLKESLSSEKSCHPIFFWLATFQKADKENRGNTESKSGRNFTGMCFVAAAVAESLPVVSELCAIHSILTRTVTRPPLLTWSRGLELQFLFGSSFPALAPPVAEAWSFGKQPSHDCHRDCHLQNVFTPIISFGSHGDLCYQHYFPHFEDRKTD